MWAVFLTGLEVQRSAGLVLLAFVGEIALNHIECFGHAFMQMCRNDRAGLHSDVQHHRPQRVVRVTDSQRDVALTLEGETIRLELTANYFLIDHDPISCVEESHTKRNSRPFPSVPEEMLLANAALTILSSRAWAPHSASWGVKVSARILIGPIPSHRLAALFHLI